MSALIQKYDNLKRAAELAVRSSQDFSPLADQILTDIIVYSIKKYQTKINVGLQDSVADLLDSFKKQLIQTISSNIALRWQIPDREPFLFPKNSRFCYRRGNTTIVVIEQDPQVRTLFLEADIIGKWKQDLLGQTVRACLALPYVIFVLRFANNVFVDLLLGWRTTPLGQLDDMLCAPVLPNMHTNLSVCMGRTRSKTTGHFSEQTINAIDYFWNSQFNNDLSTFWWEKGSIDRRLITVQTWEENSQKDPCFILSVKFKPIRTLKSLIDVLVVNEVEPDLQSLKHQMSENVDTCVADLFKGVQCYLTKTKFDKYFPKDVHSQLEEAVLGCTNELIDVVLCLEREIKQFQSEYQSRNEFVNAGPLWKDYVKEDKNARRIAETNID